MLPEEFLEVQEPGVQGGSQSSRKVAEEALGSRGEAVELDKRERQRKAVWAAAGWTGGFLVLFPAILWMRGLFDYLSRLPDRLPVSLVGGF